MLLNTLLVSNTYYSLIEKRETTKQREHMYGLIFNGLCHYAPQKRLNWFAS